MTIATYIDRALAEASWIRRMFEAGAELKQRVGADAVCDLSLGNPLLEPPAAFQEALCALTVSPPPGLHRYMPNTGFASTRAVIAQTVSREQCMLLEPSDVLMTVGAAGAIHVALHALLDPGDEVIILSPYFVEYPFYVESRQGVPRRVPTDATFGLDIDALAAALGPRTKVILLNTPNNPTGRVYPQDTLSALAKVVRRAERTFGHNIYLLFDTPYAKLTYDGLLNPLLFADHPSALIAHSFSKDLGLAGERIGYLAINPSAPHRKQLRAACAFSNRVLGFVNAPALMQRALEAAIGATVDMAQYHHLRALIVKGLEQAGYTFVVPEGAFYVFPQTPIADDVAFSQQLLAENVLVVPGTGFGRPGYIRIAFCVEPETITRAIPRLARARERVA